MDVLNENDFPITVTIVYECSTTLNYEFNENDKVQKLIDIFSTQMNINSNNFFIIYKGKYLPVNDYDKKFIEIMDNQDKTSKQLAILAYKKNITPSNKKILSNDINIILIKESETSIKLKGKKGQPLKNIILSDNSKFISAIEQYNFIYGNKEIDLNKKFEEIAEERDKRVNGLTLLVYKKDIINDENDDSINNTENQVAIQTNEAAPQINDNNNNNHGINTNSCLRKHKKKIIIISSILGVLIIVGVVVTILVLKSNSSKTNSSKDFSDTTKQSENPSYITKTPEDSSDSDSIKKTEELSGTANQIGICEQGYYIPNDDPTLQDCQKCSLEGCIKCSGTYKENICTDCGNLISVYEKEKIIKCDNRFNLCDLGKEEKCLSCVENKSQCKTCNFAYKLVDGKCKADYYMRIVYLTKQKEDKISIISDYSDLEYMYIEGKKVIPNSTSYKFQEEGNHTVYYQFKNKYSYKSKLFQNNRHVKSAFISDFDEYINAISLNYMFAGCTNLTSVDFSKLGNKYSSDTEHMFDGCINLTYVNIDNLKIKDTIYMFKDCKLLKSIDLSKIDITGAKELEYMFTGCNSLQVINLKGFKLDSITSIKGMFDNCYSLKYLDLSAFKPSQLYNKINFVNYY